MCGEHLAEVERVLPLVGSSPHVRGAPGIGNHVQPGMGIIPACAGSTTVPTFCMV